MTGVLFGGAAPIGSGGYAAATGSVGTPGLSFTVSTPLTINGIWQWTSSARAVLPTGLGLFSGTSSTLLAGASTGAVWYTSPGGSVASSTATGWIYSPFSSPVALSTGVTYSVGAFSASTSHWFDYLSPGQWPAAAVGGVTATSSVSYQGYAATSTAGVSNPALGTNYGYAFGLDLEVVTTSGPSGPLLNTVPATPPLPAQDLNPRVELLQQQAQTWVDVSSRVFYDTVAHQRGGPDESTTTTAATFSGTLDNHDGYLSTLNPSSPYYGQFGLNTNLRLSVPNGSSALVCEGTGNDYATAAVSSSYVNSPFEIWIDADSDGWYTGQTYLAGQWDTANTAGSSWYLLCNYGVLYLVCNGSSSGLYFNYSFPAFAMPQHGRISLRIAVTPSTGTAVLYSGQYLSSWVSQSTVTQGAASPIYASSQPLRVGNTLDNAGQSLGLYGKVYGFAILNAVGGTLTSNGVCQPSFAQAAVGATSFTDHNSVVWSLGGTALISDRNYRFYGECSAWPQSWSIGDPNARVTITAGGLLRRMGTTNTVTASPLRRAYTRELASIGGPAPVSYWPCEDLSASTTLASAVNQPPLTLGGSVSVGSNSSIAGSAALPATNSGWINGSVPSYTPGTGANNGTIVRWVMAQDTTGEANGTTLATFWFNGGTIGSIVLIQNNPTTLYANIYDAGGTQIGTTNSMVWNANGNGPLNGWSGTMSLEYRNSATTGQYMLNLVWAQQGISQGTNATIIASTAGTVGALKGFRLGSSTAPLTQHTSYGHVTVQTTWVSAFNVWNALQGYPNEPAGVRFQRLCAEEGIAFRGIGNLNMTQPMGIQVEDTLANLLQECVDADQAIWYETRQLLGWGFRTRMSLLNQTPAITWDYNQDHLSGSLDPTVDDQIMRNDVTVQSTLGGSSSRVSLTDGSATSVGTVGRYDVSISANVANSVLPYLAAWILWCLTRPDPRHTAISSDLANSSLSPALYYATLGLEVGDRIQILNAPAWMPPGAVDQILKGLNETISARSYSVSYNTVPASQYIVTQLNSSTYGVLDSGSAYVAPIGVNATATSLPVSMPNGTPLWSVSSGSFKIMVDGEVMTVTAVGALISGVQQLTVTRGVNGVATSHAGSAQVHVYPASVLSY